MSPFSLVLSSIVLEIKRDWLTTQRDGVSREKRMDKQFSQGGSVCMVFG